MSDDYQHFIEQNEHIKEYLTFFPKQLMLLAIEGKVIRFLRDHSILINFDSLASYLSGDESIFELSTVKDFLLTLSLLGFSRGGFQEKNEPSRYFRSCFNPSEPIPEDLHKIPAKIEGKSRNEGELRRTANVQNIQLFDRVLKGRSRCCSMTKKQFAQLKMNFALDKKLNEQRLVAETVEFTSEDPEYTKKGEIAGYYGHKVSIEDLREAFQNYFPSFAVDSESAPEEAFSVDENNMANLSGVEEMAFDLEAAHSSQAVASPTRKKPKRCKKASQLNLETEQALMFLHKNLNSGASNAL